MKETLESVLIPLEKYIRRNVCLDEDSPFHGGLLQYLISHSDTPTSGEIFSDLAVR